MKGQVFLGEVIFLFSVAVFSLLRLMILSYKYDRYLRCNHFEKWKELTTVFGIGPGMANSYRALKFLFSQNDLGDNQLIIMKARLRNAIIYAITGMLALPSIFIIIFIFTR